MCNSKLKRCLVTVLTVVVTVGVFASVIATAKRSQQTFVLPDTSTAEISTSRYTQYSQAAKISGNRLSTEGFKKVIENDTMELWFREEIHAIRVVDKNSGYIWGSLPTDTVSDLNEYWVNMANSIMTLEYYDSSNNAYQISLSDDRFVCTYTVDAENHTLSCFAECYDLGIDIGFDITLTDDHLEVAVQEDSLYEYDEAFRLCKLYFLPFFGCTPQGEMDGYLFVPDGSGALMRFDKHTIHNSSYSAKVYGLDAGIDSVTQVADLIAKRTDDYLVDEYRATIPVYGMVHGDEQYAAMTVIEGGAEYARIQASLATNTVPYNWMTTCFEYRQLYDQPVSKSNKIIRPQQDCNEMLPKISIYLLSGDKASYSGMAVKYRSLLEQNGTLSALTDTYEQIPMRLEVLGSDVKEGFIFNSVTTFTTAQQALKIQSDLADMGIHNLTMVLNGWQKGGSNNYTYGTYKPQRSVGSMAELEKLRDAVIDAGGNFYLQNRVTTLTSAQGRLNYICDMSISKRLVYYLRDNPAVMFPETYIASPSNVMKALQAATTEIPGFNLHLPRFGSELYSDYQQEAVTNRVRTRSLFTKSAEKIAEGGQQMAMNIPNQYMWEYCTDYFDIPMMNSQYLFESDSVPFLQILLKGSVHYYAPYANQGFYTTACTLKSIEYGAYPSFLVMAADNEELSETPMVDYFSLNFEDWKDTIKTVYGKTSDALQAVEGAKIMDHTVLQQGVVRVTYNNGVKIYINYNADAVTVDNGVKIAGLQYTIERG